MAPQAFGKPLFVGQDKSSQAIAAAQVWFVGYHYSLRFRAAGVTAVCCYGRKRVGLVGRPSK